MQVMQTLRFSSDDTYWPSDERPRRSSGLSAQSSSIQITLRRVGCMLGQPTMLPLEYFTAFHVGEARHTLRLKCARNRTIHRCKSRLESTASRAAVRLSLRSRVLRTRHSTSADVDV